MAEHPAPRPPTVAELAAVAGGHPNTTRHHVRALVADGLVDVRRAPASEGRGRPAARYVLTRAGREALAPAGSAAAEEYVALAGAFADRLAQRGGDPGADARMIGNAWGASLVAQDAVPSGGQAGPVEQVVGLLDRLGFGPATEPAVGEGPGARVLLRTCPLLDAARRHPEVVCQVHLGLVAGALETLGEESEGLRLIPFARPGACVLELPPTLVG